MKIHLSFSSKPYEAEIELEFDSIKSVKDHYDHPLIIWDLSDDKANIEVYDDYRE